MLKIIQQFVSDERGEDLIEYGLLAAFVAALATALLFAGSPLQTAIKNAIGKAVTALNAQ